MPMGSSQMDSKDLLCMRDYMEARLPSCGPSECSMNYVNAEIWRNCSPPMMAASTGQKSMVFARSARVLMNLTAMRLHADRGLCREIVQTIDKCPTRADVVLLNDCQSNPGRRHHKLQRHSVTVSDSGTSGYHQQFPMVATWRKGGPSEHSLCVTQVSCLVRISQ